MTPFLAFDLGIYLRAVQTPAHALRTQDTISPQSIMTGFPLFVASSCSLGYATSTGLYKYHPLSAATEARILASSSDAPAPSPTLSLPQYMPTTNTGAFVRRPVSDTSRATGASN